MIRLEPLAVAPGNVFVYRLICRLTKRLRIYVPYLIAVLEHSSWIDFPREHTFRCDATKKSKEAITDR